MSSISKFNAVYNFCFLVNELLEFNVWKILNINEFNTLAFCKYMAMTIHLLRLEGVQPVNPYKHSVLFLGHRQQTVQPRQDAQNAAYDQGLHCLLAECSIKI